MSVVSLTEQDYQSATEALAADDRAAALLSGEFGEPFTEKPCFPLLAQSLAQRLIHLGPHLSGQHSI